MNRSIRDVLKKLIQLYGKGLCKDAQRLEAFLRDYCGEYKRETNVLVLSVRLGITGEMIMLKDKTVNLCIPRWINRLYDEGGIEKNLGLWAIENWLMVLGIPYDIPPELVISSDQIAYPNDAKIKVIKEGNQDANSYYNNGIAYGKAGHHYKAIDALKKAISVNPKEANFYYALGVAYYKIDCYEQAKDMFKKVRSLNPDHIGIKGNRLIENLIVEGKK